LSGTARSITRTAVPKTASNKAAVDTDVLLAAEAEIDGDVPEVAKARDELRE
jgi:hypothetical protein